MPTPVTPPTETLNAKIERAYLGGWDNSIPSQQIVVGLQFSGDTWGQGSGHFSGHVEEFITLVLQTLEVSDWNRLPGTFCRIGRNDRGNLIAVGHLLKDQWFVFQDLYAKENNNDH